MMITTTIPAMRPLLMLDIFLLNNVDWIKNYDVLMIIFQVSTVKSQRLTVQDLLNLCNRQSDDVNQNILSSLQAIPKICGVCLGQTSNDANEIVECDSCGVAVHEGCYGILSNNQVETASVSSDRSLASTEPWFRDACRAGDSFFSFFC